MRRTYNSSFNRMCGGVLLSTPIVGHTIAAPS